MPKRLLAVLFLVTSLAFAGCGDDDSSTATDDSDSSSAAPKPPVPTRTPSDVSCTYKPGSEPAKPVEAPPELATVTGQLTGTMETSAGTFGLTLDAAQAPCTVNSFVSLADQGYFDDTTCHRITTAGILVLQCGDPSASGRGGPGYTFADELDGSETYPAGTLAMANAGPNTNGSQFFIVYGETPLPPDYTVFGTVDDATVALVEDVAADGTDEAFGQGDGAPNTPVDITWVAVD